MKHKVWIVAGLLTIGTLPALVWAYRKLTVVEVDAVSEKWLVSHNYTNGKQGYLE